jgi:hypothetical protein
MMQVIRGLMLIAALVPITLALQPLAKQSPTVAEKPTTLVAVQSYPVAGIAKYYSAGMMRTVANNRHMRLRTDVDGYAAVAACGKISSIVMASVGTLPARRYQVLDCSQTRDLAAHAREGLILEVDYATARRAGLLQTGRGRAIIYGYSK